MGGSKTPLVAHAEHQPRVAAQSDGLLGAGLGHRQRLLAKDMLAGGDGGFDLRAVKGMRRRQHDGFHRGIVERVGIVGRKRDALLRAGRSHAFDVRLDGAHDPDVRRRRLQHSEDLAAPPTHSDERDSDGLSHVGVPTTGLSKLRIGRIGGVSTQRDGFIAYPPRFG